MPYLTKKQEQARAVRLLKKIDKRIDFIHATQQRLDEELNELHEKMHSIQDCPHPEEYRQSNHLQVWCTLCGTSFIEPEDR